MTKKDALWSQETVERKAIKNVEIIRESVCAGTSYGCFLLFHFSKGDDRYGNECV